MSSENKENGFTTLGSTFDESTNANMDLPPQTATGNTIDYCFVNL